jgi:hypothetical protein
MSPGLIFKTWSDKHSKDEQFRNSVLSALKVSREFLGLPELKDVEKNVLCTLVEKEVTGLCWVLIDGQLTTRYEDELEAVE